MADVVKVIDSVSLLIVGVGVAGLLVLIGRAIGKLSETLGGK